MNKSSQIASKDKHNITNSYILRSMQPVMTVGSNCCALIMETFSKRKIWLWRRDFCKVYDPCYFCKNARNCFGADNREVLACQERDNMTAECHVLVKSCSPCTCSKLSVLPTVVLLARCHISCKHCCSINNSSVLSQHFPKWRLVYEWLLPVSS